VDVDGNPLSTHRIKGPRILIAGLGNLLLKDDGVGIHAIRELQKSPPRGVVVAEIGTAVLDGLHLLEWADRILAFDAMQAGGPPGTLYSFSLSDAAPKPSNSSLHEMDLLAALRFLPKHHPAEVKVLGVEPGVIDYGLDLTPDVAAALPLLLNEALRIVREWSQAPLPGTARSPSV
jgi:hydrogenase maturation protease